MSTPVLFPVRGGFTSPRPNSTRELSCETVLLLLLQKTRVRTDEGKTLHHSIKGFEKYTKQVGPKRRTFTSCLIFFNIPKEHSPFTSSLFPINFNSLPQKGSTTTGNEIHQQVSLSLCPRVRQRVETVEFSISGCERKRWWGGFASLPFPFQHSQFTSITESPRLHTIINYLACRSDDLVEFGKCTFITSAVVVHNSFYLIEVVLYSSSSFVSSLE